MADTRCNLMLGLYSVSLDGFLFCRSGFDWLILARHLAAGLRFGIPGQGAVASVAERT